MKTKYKQEKRLNVFKSFNSENMPIVLFPSIDFEIDIDQSVLLRSFALIDLFNLFFLFRKALYKILKWFSILFIQYDCGDKK